MKKNQPWAINQVPIYLYPFFSPDTGDPQKIRMSNTKSAKMLSLFLL